MEVQDAEKLVARLNVLQRAFSGTDTKPGILQSIEAAAKLLDQATAKQKEELESVGQELTAQLVRTIERDLKAAIERMGEDASLTAIEMLAEESVSRLLRSIDTVATRAADLAFEESHSAREKELARVAAELEKKLVKIIEKQNKDRVRMQAHKARIRELRGQVSLLKITAWGLLGVAGLQTVFLGLILLF